MKASFVAGEESFKTSPASYRVIRHSVPLPVTQTAQWPILKGGCGILGNEFEVIPMAIDGIVTRALTRESDQLLSGGRITKIYQPSETDIVLHIRANGHNWRLLLSAHPVYARVHLTQQTYQNPLEPPMFCMLLRKHVEGGFIRNFGQVGLERILFIDVETRDELGDIVTRRIVVELMGRHSNIVLINPEDRRVFDGIRRVTPAVSRYRQIVPGATYKRPPEQGKRNPLSVDEDMFLALLNFNQGRLDKQLVQLFDGIGPTLAKEIVHRAGIGSRSAYWQAFHSIMECVRNYRFEPTIVYGAEKERFAAFPLTYVEGERHSFRRMHDCVAAFYEGKAERDAVRNRVHDLTRLVQTALKKNEKKMKKLEREWRDTEKADRYRLYGELLTAYMHQVKPGDKKIEVVNYYDAQGEVVTIPLDPNRSPAENAQRYFKKYQKAKASRLHIQEQSRKTAEENRYLATVLQQLEDADLEDVADIREELEREGYVRKQKTAKARRETRQAKPQLTVTTSSEGVPIYIGRNNRQNDYLTSRLANSHDTWLHTKDIPGSHVVIRGRDFGERTLREAAQIAAYFSKGRTSAQVPVDYTLIKHVRKPKGAKPGYVIYDNHKTLYVTPDESFIRKLRFERK